MASKYNSIESTGNFVSKGLNVTHGILKHIFIYYNRILRVKEHNNCQAPRNVSWGDKMKGKDWTLLLSRWIIIAHKMKLLRVACGYGNSSCCEVFVVASV